MTILTAIPRNECASWLFSFPCVLPVHAQTCPARCTHAHMAVASSARMHVGRWPARRLYRQAMMVMMTRWETRSVADGRCPPDRGRRRPRSPGCHTAGRAGRERASRTWAGESEGPRSRNGSRYDSRWDSSRSDGRRNRGKRFAQIVTAHRDPKPVRPAGARLVGRRARKRPPQPSTHTGSPPRPRRDHRPRRGRVCFPAPS